MTAASTQKRKRNDFGSKKKPLRLSKKQRLAAAYHSSSEDEEDIPTGANRLEARRVVRVTDANAHTNEDAIELPNLIQEHQRKDASGTDLENTARVLVHDPGSGVADGLATPLKSNDGDEDEDEDVVGDEDESQVENDIEDDFDDEEDDEDHDTGASKSHEEALNDSTSRREQLKKRNDPSIFANSISKILDSKLTTAKRADPVLSRSKEATETSKELAEDRLEAKARRKIRDEKRAALDRSRDQDVLGVDSAGVTTTEVAELEKRLKKTAQRGVVKLFNAVRAAQVKGEEAAVETRNAVGLDKRKDKINEMSKKGFLDLLVEGGK